MVARLNGVQEAVSSTLATRTKDGCQVQQERQIRKDLALFCFYGFNRGSACSILDLLDKEEIKYRSEKRLLGYRNKGKRRLAGNANQPIIINIDDVADVIDVRAEYEFARVELLVSLKQELERLSPRELMIIRTYLDYPIEVVARKLKVRPNTISKARRKIARELRKNLV